MGIAFDGTDIWTSFAGSYGADVGDCDGDGVTDQADLGILLAYWDCTGDDCVGDINGDGNVDQQDLGILLADWDCELDCVGDLDFDGDTDQADLGILLAHWGEGCP